MNRMTFPLLAWLMRRGPQSVRRWRLLTASLGAARRLGPTMAVTKVRTRHGFRMKADLNDWLGQHLFATGDYEPPTSALLSELVAPGDAVIDVGANCGYFTLLMAKKVGVDGHVFSFEPIPLMCDRLKEHVDENRMRNITVTEGAASDRCGEVDFYVGPANHRGVSSLRKISNADECIRVAMLPLDSFDFGNRNIAVVKIDVEGAECSVIRGMSAVLERDRPDLVVEVVDRFLKEFGDSGAALYSTLHSYGYRMYEITTGGLRLHSDWSDAVPQHFNAFFTCRSMLPKSVVVV